MTLQVYTLALGNFRDDTSGNNYAANTPVYILNSGGTLADIFRDQAGAQPIAQDGLNNISDAYGEFTFYVNSGQYISRVAGRDRLINVVGSDYFDSRVDDAVEQITQQTLASRGFRVVGTFADGFTYELFNDVGIDADGNSWIYVGAGAPNKVVTAGTVPSVGAGYEQVTFNSDTNILTASGKSIRQEGIGIWDTNTVYPINGLAKGSDGNVYKALVEQSGNNPVGDTVNWESMGNSLPVLSDGSITSRTLSSRFGETFNALDYGVAGDGVTDDTTAIQALMAAANANGGCVVFPMNTYIMNDSIDIKSNVTIEANFSTFITTSSASIGFITRGAYNNLVSNVNILKAKTMGYSIPFVALHTSQTRIEQCVSIDALNIAFQSQGDYNENVVFDQCIAVNPGFHCFASNDSTAFDPAHTRQGQRYPLSTFFNNCVAKDAQAMAFDIHANEESGISSVKDCVVINCNQVGKATYGNATWDNLTIRSEGITPLTWFWQVGNTSDGVTTSHTTVKNCRLFIDRAISLFLLLGNCTLEDNKVIFLGGGEPSMFQVKNGLDINITNNSFYGDLVTYKSGKILNDSSGGGTGLGTVNFSQNNWYIPIGFGSSNDELFSFNNSSLQRFIFRDNYLNTQSVGVFLLIDNNPITDIIIEGNSSEEVIQFLVKGSSPIDSFWLEGNKNIESVSRWFSNIYRTYIKDNTSKNFSNEGLGTVGSETIAIPSFIAGEIYEVDMFTDISNASTAFLSRAKYTVIVSRDGAGIKVATQDLGQASNILAVFTISGSDIVMSVKYASLHHVNVRRIGSL